MRHAVDAEPARGVLHVIHDHGGGTETHVRALIAASRGRWRHCLAIAVGDRWQVEEHRADGAVVTFDLSALPDEPLARLPRRPVRDVRHRRSSTCTTSPPAATAMLAALAALDLPYGYTVHDLNFACPTITFLAARRDVLRRADRRRDLRRAASPRSRAFAGVDIVAWRDAPSRLLVERAAFLIAPSRWAADTLARYFPSARRRVIAHGVPGGDAAARARTRRRT